MKKSSKVIVVISTYNGEKYISEQLDSILNQTYKNLEIYIRDDCSTDNTYKILLDYGKKNKNVHVKKGIKNLGYPACFYKLTDSLPKADYYFFSDQDDIWLENKVELAVKCLDKKDNKKVLAYYSRYNICDKNMNIIAPNKYNHKKIRFKDTLYEVCGLEFTMAINYKAMKLLRNYRPKKVKARGTWMSMLFSSNGEIIIDDNITALYRRHENAVTSSKLKGIGLLIWRFKKFIVNNEISNYRNILLEFKNTCFDILNEKDKKTINFFTKNSFKKVLYPHRLRNSLKDEILLRILFLIRKL